MRSKHRLGSGATLREVIGYKLEFRVKGWLICTEMAMATDSLHSGALPNLSFVYGNMESDCSDILM